MQTSGELERQIFDWAFRSNLQFIVNYHNFIRAKLHEQYHQDETTNSDQDVLSRYDQINANNCFLMAYAHLEEFLYCVWKAFVPDTALPPNKYSVERFKPALSKAGVNLGTSPSWEFIVSASLVRDCLLHANGRFSHMRQKQQQDLRKHLNSQDDLVITRNRLSVTPGYLKLFVEHVEKLRCAATHAKVGM